MSKPKRAPRSRSTCYVSTEVARTELYIQHLTDGMYHRMLAQGKIISLQRKCTMVKLNQFVRKMMKFDEECSRNMNELMKNPLQPWAEDFTQNMVTSLSNLFWEYLNARTVPIEQLKFNALSTFLQVREEMVARFPDGYGHPGTSTATEAERPAQFPSRMPQGQYLFPVGSPGPRIAAQKFPFVPYPRGSNQTPATVQSYPNQLLPGSPLNLGNVASYPSQLLPGSPLNLGNVQQPFLRPTPIPGTSFSHPYPPQIQQLMSAVEVLKKTSCNLNPQQQMVVSQYKNVLEKSVQTSSRFIPPNPYSAIHNLLINHAVPTTILENNSNGRRASLPSNTGYQTPNICPDTEHQQYLVDSGLLQQNTTLWPSTSQSGSAFRRINNSSRPDPTSAPPHSDISFAPPSIPLNNMNPHLINSHFLFPPNLLLSSALQRMQQQGSSRTSPMQAMPSPLQEQMMLSPNYICFPPPAAIPRIVKPIPTEVTPVEKGLYDRVYNGVVRTLSTASRSPSPVRIPEQAHIINKFTGTSHHAKEVYRTAQLSDREAHQTSIEPEAMDLRIQKHSEVYDSQAAGTSESVRRSTSLFTPFEVSSLPISASVGPEVSLGVRTTEGTSTPVSQIILSLTEPIIRGASTYDCNANVRLSNFDGQNEMPHLSPILECEAAIVGVHEKQVFNDLDQEIEVVSPPGAVQSDITDDTFNNEILVDTSVNGLSALPTPPKSTNISPMLDNEKQKQISSTPKRVQKLSKVFPQMAHLGLHPKIGVNSPKRSTLTSHEHNILAMVFGTSSSSRVPSTVTSPSSEPDKQPPIPKLLLRRFPEPHVINIWKEPKREIVSPEPSETSNRNATRRHKYRTEITLREEGIHAAVRGLGRRCRTENVSYEESSDDDHFETTSKKKKRSHSLR